MLDLCSILTPIIKAVLAASHTLLLLWFVAFVTLLLLSAIKK